MIVECGALSASSSFRPTQHSNSDFTMEKKITIWGAPHCCREGEEEWKTKVWKVLRREKKGRWGTAELRTTVKGRNWSETQAAQQTKINIHMNYHNSVAVVEGERKAGKDER